MFIKLFLIYLTDSLNDQIVLTIFLSLYKVVFWLVNITLF